MKKIRMWLLSFIVLLGLAGIFYSPITVNAASDASGTWGPVDWEFESSSGTLTFTSGGVIPANSGNRTWANSSSTEYGLAIKKIIFEQQCVLPEKSSWLFQGLENLEEIESFDKLEASGVTSMYGMFSLCKKLKNLSGVENWKVENVRDMSTMFSFCSSLENIDALSYWKTSNVMNMSAMFANCSSLENADALGNWNTENGPLLSDMFFGCENLESVNLSLWNTKNVIGFGSMFSGCSKLKSITLGANSILDSSVNLPDIDTTMGTYTGEWIGRNTEKIYDSSDDFMDLYDGSYPDTYVWRGAPTYNAGYTFVSGTTGEELPTEVTDLLPSDPADYENDAVVTAISPEQTTISTNAGTWTFQGWDADSKTVSGDDVIFTGTWTFKASDSEAPTYNAGYVFKSGTTGKELPKAVTDLLPSDPANYENDAVVTAISPEQTTISTSAGTWTFQGWDADSKTVSGDDVVFTGTWTFEASEPDASDNSNTSDTPNNSGTPSKTDTPSNPDTPSTLDKPNQPATQNNQNTPDSLQKTGKVTTEFPKTGDTQLSGLWGIAFLLSGIALLILKIRKRKIG